MRKFLSATGASLALAMLVGLIAASAPAFGSGEYWYDASWDYRVPITIDHSLVPSSLANFPVYVDLSALPSGFWSHVSSGGDDIRVTTTDGITEVPIDVVSIDTANETGELFFKAPTLSSSSDSVFFLYYGDASASAYSAASTYGSQNVWTAFTGVWLFEEAAGGSAAIKDRTSNAYHMSTTGSQLSFQVAGPNGTPAISRTGSTAEVSRAITDADVALPSGDLTVISWVKTNADSQNGNAQFVWEETGGRFRFFTTGSTAWQWRVYKTTGSLSALSGYTLDQTWQRVAVRISTGDGGSYAYLDGSQVNSSATVNSYIGTTGKIAVLQSSSPSQGANGAVSHLFISTTDLGASWIAADAANQESPSTFALAGSEEAAPAGSPEYSTEAALIFN